MKPENEKRIFGYVDPEPPIPGSWKAEVFKLIEQVEGVGGDALEQSILEFAVSFVRMRKSQERLFIDASKVAKDILLFAVAPGNGGYVSSFGTVTYSRLVFLATGGETDYCQAHGHTRHAELNRCIFCCKPMEAK